MARAGEYRMQTTGHRAFVPKPLPPEPPLRMDEEIVALLSEADVALGRLDGAASILPNPELFVGMYTRKEAVLSSQIEGTQATLVDLLAFEASPPKRSVRSDVQEVVNHVAALNHALVRVQTLPLSLRLLREVHEVLMRGARGGNRFPGEFRTTQNWIGPPGAGLVGAVFVPPPPAELPGALGEFERFLHQRGRIPPLVHCGLAHAQFETIHPFIDGNGRMGRLLITLLLMHHGMLRRPLLYLSHYLREHREMYGERLQNIRDRGDWEGWLVFFLRGVAEVAVEATATAQAILEMKDAHTELLLTESPGNPRVAALVEALMDQPVISIGAAADRLHVSHPTARKLIGLGEHRGLLREITGQSRYQRFLYAPYVDLLSDRSSGS